MTFLEERVILSYCAGDRSVGLLNRLKVLSITRDELQRADDFLERPSPPLLENALDYGRSFTRKRAGTRPGSGSSPAVA